VTREKIDLGKSPVGIDRNSVTPKNRISSQYVKVCNATSAQAHDPPHTSSYFYRLLGLPVRTLVDGNSYLSRRGHDQLGDELHGLDGLVSVCRPHMIQPSGSGATLTGRSSYRFIV